MSKDEKLDYVLGLFKTNKMDMQLATIQGLIPEYLKRELPLLLSELQQLGLINYKDKWWFSTSKGRNFPGFTKANIIFLN
jgi:hypothetical protein